MWELSVWDSLVYTVLVLLLMLFISKERRKKRKMINANLSIINKPTATVEAICSWVRISMELFSLSETFGSNSGTKFFVVKAGQICKNCSQAIEGLSYMVKFNSIIKLSYILYLYNSIVSFERIFNFTFVNCLPFSKTPKLNLLRKFSKSS